MVNNWYPDPPRDMEDDMSMPSENVAVESEDSEDEMLGNAPPGYELLPQGPALGLSSDEVKFAIYPCAIQCFIISRVNIQYIHSS